MGHEGNDFFRILELPGLERLAAVEKGDRVLDLATGNGLVARRLAELGATVTATDASRGMLEFAERRTEKDENLKGKITYGLLDVTSDEDLKGMVEKAEKVSLKVRSLHLPLHIDDLSTSGVPEGGEWNCLIL
jgi:SAM-dependent methyltransferase